MVVVVITVLTALGLGVVALGSMDTEAARDGLAVRQAAFAAEAGLRAVKHWFDAPAGSAGAWMVPVAGEVDRTLRKVDPDGDGTSEPVVGAAPPWNVVYREGRDDLFERPYRGSPSLALEGDAKGPDLLLSADSSNADVRDFLLRLSAGLFPEGPAPNVGLRITRVAVYAPPSVSAGGIRHRFGIASIEVSAAVVRGSSAAGEPLASAHAKGVIEEIPYSAAGPLSARAIEDGTGLDVRWGTLSAEGDVDFGVNPAAAFAGGWPWRTLDRRLIEDADSDGTLDDTDADGTADLAEWLGVPDGLLRDPWFRLLAGGSLAGAPGPVQQPFPFDPAVIPGAYRTDDDRAALFQQVPAAVSYQPDARLFRAAAADGGPGVHLMLYVAGSDPPLFREGSLPTVSFEAATRGRQGLFYFDTADSLPPKDSDGDGSFDNLTPPIVVSDPGWWSEGCLFLNSVSFSPGDSARPASGEIAPPGEPFADLDGDGTCNDGEPFLRIGYPPDPLAPGAAFSRMGIQRESSGGIPRLASGPAASVRLTFAGLILTTGRLAGPSSARIFGAIAASGPVSVPSAAGAEPLQLLYDDRLAHDGWPPSSSRLPRTVWQARAVSP